MHATSTGNRKGQATFKNGSPYSNIVIQYTTLRKYYYACAVITVYTVLVNIVKGTSICIPKSN